jgi:hypothetical protein
MATVRGVLFYEHRDFDGNAYGPIKPGSYGWVEEVGIPNDSISSWRWTGLEDPNNGYVTFYEHRNFGGKETEFQGDVKFVGDPLNDRLSSFKIRIDEDAERKALLDKRLQQAKNEAEARKVDEQIAIINAGGSLPSGGTGGSPFTGGSGVGSLRTYEIFGVVNGQTVPITRAVTNNGGRWQLVPGARVLIGDNASDGFGLGGVPGRWSAFYPTQSPSAFGLDSDKAVLASDGNRGWVTEAAWLAQIFGPNWRQVVY